MSSLSVTVDTTVDLDPGSTSKANPKRNLLLAPPSIAAHEEKLRDLFTTFDRSSTDLQMLDRLSAGFVTLPPDTYDLVLVLTDTDGAQRAEALQLLSRDVLAALVPSMKVGARLQTQGGHLGGAEVREAVLAGLVEKDGGFEKPEEEVVVPLRFGAKKNGVKNGALNGALNTAQNGAQNGAQSGVSINFDDFGDYDDGDNDELIDEDTLMTEEDLKRPIQLRKPTYLNPSPSLFRFHY
jgi:hypothetical protein